MIYLKTHKSTGASTLCLAESPLPSRLRNAQHWTWSDPQLPIAACFDPWNKLTLWGLGEGLNFTSIREAESFVKNHKTPLNAPFSGPIAFALLPFNPHSSKAPQIRVPALLLWRKGNQSGLVLQHEHTDHLELLQKIHAHTCAPHQRQLEYHPLESPRHWNSRVQDILNKIKKGELSKVVPASPTQISSSQPFSPGNCLASLVQNYPSSLSFAWKLQESNCYFVGSTPELLLKSDVQQTQCCALAGTIDISSSPEQASQQINADLKERREHQLVVQDILEKLQQLTQSQSIKTTLRHRIQGHILHLETLLTAPTLRTGLAECLTRMHPTPALCGAPFAQAKDWLDENEEDRGYFAGPIGWFSPDQATFGVAIRSATLHQNKAIAWAGAGVVLGSNPQREWQETRLKLAIIAKALSTSVAATGAAP